VHLVGKFNRVSMAQDFPERLQLVTS
jgi:hypothetical protein